MDIRSVLDQVDLGSGALARGNHEQARQCFLAASLDLLGKARESRGARRDRLIDQANRLMHKARGLGGDGKAQGPGAMPACAGDEGLFPIMRGGELSLDDVAGLQQAKRSFNAKFIYPLRHPEAAARYKQSGSGGLLLFGPPGTGKTFLVRALASEIGAPIFTVKPSDIMSKYVGESEQNLSTLFEQANLHEVALIFIDEIDALAPARKGGSDSVMEQLVPQLLAELDGFERRSNKLLFLGATNEPWSLDAAIMRPGRFDELVYVGLPELEARQQMLVTHLDGVPLDADVAIGEIAEMTEGYTGADLFGISVKATQAAYIELIETGRERPVSLADFEQTLAQTPRSVTRQMLERYAAFRNQS